MRTILAMSLLCFSALAASFSLRTEWTTNGNIVTKTVVFRTVGSMSSSNRISAIRIPMNLTNKVVTVLSNSFLPTAMQLKGVQTLTKDK